MSSPEGTAVPSGSGVATTAYNANSDSDVSVDHDTHAPIQSTEQETLRPDSLSDGEATDSTSSRTRSDEATDLPERPPEATIPTEQLEAAASLREAFETSAAQRFPVRSSSMRAPARPYTQYDEPAAAEQQSLWPSAGRHGSAQSGHSSVSPEVALPRWQPDAEVTYCPICQTQFNFFVRKHHCRKCGRVVCNSCSPHRIIIPQEYIVRPPGSELSVAFPPSLFVERPGTYYLDATVSGGERVRLCNPCVPDPNIAPPQSPIIPGSPRLSHRRARSSIGGVIPNTTARLLDARGSDESSDGSWPRSRSITVVQYGQPPLAASSETLRTSTSYRQTNRERYIALANRQMQNMVIAESSSSRRRTLPRTPQIAEEDECPICHRELPSRSLPNFEGLRQTHITECIREHSRYGSPRSVNPEATPSPPVAPRRSGMYTYKATEKDCVDEAECTICLEEFEVGVAMGRLECLCRFHYKCISAWFVNHPGRCPVHQHDGFGY